MKKFILFLVAGSLFYPGSQAQQKADPQKLGAAMVTMYVLDSTFQKIKTPCLKVDGDYSQKFDAAYAKWNSKNRSYVQVGKTIVDNQRESVRKAEEKYMREGFPADDKEADEFHSANREISELDLQMEKLEKAPVTLSGCEFFLSLMDPPATK